MSRPNTQMVFSPQVSTLELLEKNLTASRRQIAESVLGGLLSVRGNNQSANTLLIGPRGAGKTHILSYIHKKLEVSNGGISIIRLSEEERCISSLFDFIVTCLRAAGVSLGELSANLKNLKESERLRAARDV